MIFCNYDLFLFFYITKNPPAQEKEVNKEPAQGLSRHVLIANTYPP